MNVMLIMFVAYDKWPQGYRRGTVDPVRRCAAHAMEGGVAYPATGRARNTRALGDLTRVSNTRRVLVLFSGPQRDDDIGSCLRSAGVAVTEFDLVRGDDLLDQGTRLGAGPHARGRQRLIRRGVCGTTLLHILCSPAAILLRVSPATLDALSTRTARVTLEGG